MVKSVPGPHAREYMRAWLDARIKKGTYITGMMESIARIKTPLNVLVLEDPKWEVAWVKKKEIFAVDRISVLGLTFRNGRPTGDIRRFYFRTEKDEFAVILKKFRFYSGVDSADDSANVDASEDDCHEDE